MKLLLIQGKYFKVTILFPLQKKYERLFDKNPDTNDRVCDISNL